MGGENVSAILLGAEGVSEIPLSWWREPSIEEMDALRARVRAAGHDYDKVVTDRIGRPYFPVVLTDAVNVGVRERAIGCIRRLRLED